MGRNEKLFGGYTDVGRLLGISPQAVEKAHRAGRITEAFTNARGLPRFPLDTVAEEYLRNTRPVSNKNMQAIASAEMLAGRGGRRNAASGNAAPGNTNFRRAALGNAALGNAALGNAALGNTSLAATDFRNSAGGNVAPGNTGLGNECFGNTAMGGAAFGNTALGNDAEGNALGNRDFGSVAFGNSDETDVERYNRARADNEELKTRQLEIDLAIKRREYISRAETQIKLGQIVKAVTTRLLSLPQKQFTRGDVTKAGRNRLSDDIRLALEDLSRWQPGEEWNVGADVEAGDDALAAKGQ